MSSPYPPVDDENPLLLTIRGAQFADANGNSVFRANAGRLNFGSANGIGLSARTDRSVSGKSEYRTTIASRKAAGGEELGLGYGQENTESRAIGIGTGRYEGSGGTGGKLRSVRRGNKRTPYERPATGRHATAGGSTASLPESKLTIASRLKDSATRLLHSSASYLFSALFKRQPVSIRADGEPVTALSIAVKEEQAEAHKAPESQNYDSQVPASNVVIEAEAVEGRVFDIVQVEEILKQKTWSREQVKRLTDILQTRVSDKDAVDLPLIVEKSPGESKTDVKDLVPVQVARAYMGEQATRPSGIAASVRKSAFRTPDVPATSGRTVMEDRYQSSPFSRQSALSSASLRMPKRSLVMEDDLGPVRRVRQKTSTLMSSRPYSYSRRMTGLSKPLEMQTSSPPSQSSQTALKILETLEKLTPSPQRKLLEAPTEKSLGGLRAMDKFSPSFKGKSLNEVGGATDTSVIEHTPETSNSRESRGAPSFSFVTSPPASTELTSGGELTLVGPAHTGAGAQRTSKIEAPPVTPESHNIISSSKGFRMNAVFEESNSDEEAKLQVISPVSNEAREVTAALEEEFTIPPLVSSSTGDVSALLVDSLSGPVQSVLPSSQSTCTPFSTAVFAKAETSLPTHSFCSHEPIKSPLSNAMSPPSTTSESVVSVPTSVAAAKWESPPIFTSEMDLLERKITSTSATMVLASSAFTVTAPPPSAPEMFGKVTMGTVGILSMGSPSPKSSIMHKDHSKPDNIETTAIESRLAEKMVEVDTMATDSMAEEAEIPNVTSSTLVLASNACPMPSFSFNRTAQSAASSAFSFAAGIPTSSASGSMFAFGQSGTASTSEQAPTFAAGALSSGATFSFGGQSGMSFAGQAPTFSSFGGQTTGQASSFIAGASLSFGGQSGTGSSGQAPSFGALPGASANPFTSASAGNSSSPFTFGSSSATSVVFSSTSSPAIEFAGPSSAPLYGAPATSSPFLSGTFASSTTANSSFTAMSSSPAPVSSATPVFSYGGGAISSQSAGPASSFAFGATAQSNPFTSNPFSSSGTQDSAHAFNFGSPAPAATPSPFAFGSTGSSASMFSSNTVPNQSNLFGFGATSNPSPFAVGSGQSAPAPVPFQFGGQGATTPSGGQPFAFGGQPPAPAQNPFSAAATTQPGSEFAGGFALGATGGDKSGRRIIKAKRIGGAKRK